MRKNTQSKIRRAAKSRRKRTSRRRVSRRRVSRRRVSRKRTSRRRVSRYHAGAPAWHDATAQNEFNRIEHKCSKERAKNKLKSRGINLKPSEIPESYELQPHERDQLTKEGYVTFWAIRPAVVDPRATLYDQLEQLYGSIIEYNMINYGNR